MNSIKQKLKLDFKYISPAQILVLGFLVVILIGSVLLYMPFSLQKGVSISYIDSLFISASAVCVTGLSPINVSETFSHLGHFILLLLIQVGGLGFMTFVSISFIMFRKKISLKGRILMQESYSQDTLAGLVFMTRKIIKFTFIIELIGAIFLAFKFIPEHGLLLGIKSAIFHSISAFCNAGFDIVGGSSLAPYSGSYLVSLTIMALIILGGIGFFVMNDISETIFTKTSNRHSFKFRVKRLTLHTKLVITSTLALIILGTIAFFLVESFNPSTMGYESADKRLLISAFQSVTARTAGFNTIALANATDTTQFIYIILMVIGGSPTSTAGGIKTTTFAVLLISVMSVIKGKHQATIFNKAIPQSVITKAMTLFFLGVSTILFGTMLLNITENCTFMESLFEVASAFATVGSSLGITGSLSTIGKCIIITLMFIGRLGTITVAMSLTSMLSGNTSTEINLPEGKVILG